VTFFTRRKFIAIAAALALGHGLPASAATDWPTGPIRFIVPSAAGGGADTVARLLAQHVGGVLKQSVVVENRPGGSGVIGSNALLSAPADGHTFMLGFTTMSQLPATTSAKLPYETSRDFTPVSLVARSTNVLMTSRSNVDADSVKKLVEALKANPQKYSYGSYGNGSTGHFLGAQFSQQTATSAQHVPYKGAAPMMVDLLGGVVAFAFPDIGSALPHLGSDRVRALAVTGEKRMASLPDIPTMQELGYSGFNLGAWFGLFAAKNVPDPIIQAMAKQIADAVANPEVRAKLVGMNLDPVGSDSKSFTEFFHRDLKLWADLADKADIRTQ
jgi:tripartite-type tricarboxylate transporter receptor subunit TctC